MPQVDRLGQAQGLPLHTIDIIGRGNPLWLPSVFWIVP